MGCTCAKVSNVEVNQVFYMSKDTPVKSYFEYPLSSSNLNPKFKNEEDALIDSSDKFSEISKIGVNLVLKSESEKSDDKGNRSRKKMISTIHNYKKLDEMLKFDENKRFKIINRNNENLNDINLILDAIYEIPIFKNIFEEKSMWFDFIKEMQFIEVPKDTMFIKQNSIGKQFYVLRTGRVKVMVNNVHVGDIQAPKGLGERALSNDFLRAASIITYENCYLYVLQIHSFLKIYDFLNHKKGFYQNKNFIENHFTLKSLSEEQRFILSKHMNKLCYETGSYIFKEGASLTSFYILKEGEAIIRHKDEFIRYIKHGEIFAFTQFITGNKPNFSVVATTNVNVYSVNINTIKLMFGKEYKQLFQNFLIKSAFMKDSTFHLLVNLINDEVLSNFEIIYYPIDTKVIKAFTNLNEEIRIILEGDLQDETLKKRVRSELNDVICAEDVYYNYKKTQNNCLKAYPECLMACISRKKFIDLFGVNFNILVDYINKAEIFEKNPIMKNLSLKNIKDLKKFLKLGNYNNEVILDKNENLHKLFIIKSGKVKLIYSNKEYKIITQHDYFGEKSLFFDEKSQFVAYAKGYVECLTLSKRDIEEVLKNSNELKEFIKIRILALENNLNISDLLFVKKIENYSNFGQILIVKNSRNQVFYYLSCFLNNYEDDEKYKKMIENKSILMKIDSPHIVKFFNVFNNSNFHFFVSEYVFGSDLCTVLKEIGLCSLELAKFYGACILCAINYLHTRKIIYRDLKPENLIVSKNGYLKISDMRNIKEFIKDKTQTRIGTPHYMAPEIIVNCEYKYEVDYWSLGICLFEFVYGYLPFGDYSNDPIEIFSSILNEQIKFPNEIVDTNFKELVSNLLEKNFSKRLSNYNQFKDHKFYVNFDWEEMESLSIEAPYKPRIESFDSSYCIPLTDYFDTLELQYFNQKENKNSISFN